jgi:hypothetical protein
MAKAEPKLTDKKAVCPQCRGERKCDIRGSYQHNYEDADGMFWGRAEWFILQCRGCEFIFVQTVSTDSEHTDYTYKLDGSGDYDAIAEETIKYWPLISNRKLPEGAP